MRYFPVDSKIPQILFGIGALGLVASLAGYFFGHDNHDQFFFSYLVSFAFFTGIGIASLLIVMIHHITRSTWGVLFRRIPETFAANMFVWGLFVIPVILGIHNLYHWSHEEALLHDSILEGKSAYLNPTFFIIRQVIYFLLWGFLGFKLYKASVNLEKTNDWGITSQMRKISAPGLPLLAFTIAFSGFDWLMSLDPHWFSTMFGVYFFAINFQALWPVLILMVFFLQRLGLLKNTIRDVHIFDLGAWFFAFTVFYAYIAFSQFLLIYYANMPEETLWFYNRLEGNWKYIAYSLILIRFALPFFVLLNRRAKKNHVVLTVMSIIVLAIHYAEIYWIAMPALSPDGIHVSWLDATTFLGLGGIFFGLFFRRFKQNSMVAINDPKMDACLEKTFHQ